jgi:predicted DCC family thiol-disulfide oxidoreductase YuxK
MVAEPKLEIYLDGSCGFCQWSRAQIEPWDTRGRLRFLDYNDPHLAEQAPYTREELASEMHLREPDGTWSAGFAAWVRILRVLPGLAWLGWMLGLPPLRWVGPSVYGWVARHRQLLPGAPESCTPANCPPKAPAPGRRAS